MGPLSLQRERRGKSPSPPSPARACRPMERPGATPRPRPPKGSRRLPRTGNGPGRRHRLPACLAAHVTARKRLPLRSGRLQLPAYPMPHVAAREPPPPRAIPAADWRGPGPRLLGPAWGGREGSGGRVLPHQASPLGCPLLRGRVTSHGATHTHTHTTISEFFLYFIVSAMKSTKSQVRGWGPAARPLQRPCSATGGILFTVRRFLAVLGPPGQMVGG